MSSTRTYRRNAYRQEMVQRFGQTVGLPLFAEATKQPPERMQKRLENAPKAVELATATRRLGHMVATIDHTALAEKQRVVLELIESGEDWTYQELAAGLHWSVNRVIPRVYELRGYGRGPDGQPAQILPALVVVSRKRACRVTGEVVTAWRAQ